MFIYEKGSAASLLLRMFTSLDKSELVNCKNQLTIADI
jgi:hypothetical protein